jgi:hypothetical protein
VPIYTADYYRVNPANYLGKEVPLAVAYVMPSDHSRADGLQELRANTYNQNRFGGHISIVATPEIAKRVAQQCGVQHVWDHSVSPRSAASSRTTRPTLAITVSM